VQKATIYDISLCTRTRVCVCTESDLDFSEGLLLTFAVIEREAFVRASCSLARSLARSLASPDRLSSRAKLISNNKARARSLIATRTARCYLYLSGSSLYISLYIENGRLNRACSRARARTSKLGGSPRAKRARSLLLLCVHALRTPLHCCRQTCMRHACSDRVQRPGTHRWR